LVGSSPAAGGLRVDRSRGYGPNRSRRSIETVTIQLSPKTGW